MLNFFIRIRDDALRVNKVAVDVQNSDFVVFIMDEFADDEGNFPCDVTSSVRCICRGRCPELDANGVLEGSVSGFRIHIVVGGVGDIVVVVLAWLSAFESGCCWRKVHGGKLQLAVFYVDLSTVVTVEIMARYSSVGLAKSKAENLLTYP